MVFRQDSAFSQPHRSAPATSRAMTWEAMAKGIEKLGEVKARAGAGGARFRIDFGRRWAPRYLYSFRGVRFENEAMAQAIDQEIRQILDMAYERARNIIVAQQRKLEALAGALLEQETVERPAFEALMA